MLTCRLKDPRIEEPAAGLSVGQSLGGMKELDSKAPVSFHTTDQKVRGLNPRPCDSRTEKLV
jgi:hypothetical protein